MILSSFPMKAHRRDDGMAYENGYEIDFLAVGEGERSGDAIAVRWADGDGFKV